MRIFLLSLIAVGLLIGCREQSHTPQGDQRDSTATNPATTIVETAIDRAGGERYDTTTISFDFRDIRYTSARKGGQFELSRTRTDSAGYIIHDCLDNLGFQRTINGEPINLPDSLERLFSNSVNSVHYFAQLPYGLNNTAVHHKLLDTVKMGNHEYFKIEITFDENGGGEDHEDIFIYWIHRENFTVDYLAYLYHTDGGGMRFRVAINPRTVGHIRWVDYRNYKPQHNKVDFYKLDSLYRVGALELLSLIELHNIEVSRTTTL